jgi:ferrochelatase
MTTAPGILLLAYGGPDSLEDIGPYLEDIRGGRPTSPELLAEVRARYAAIGGRSPLLEITRAQAAALQAATGLRTYVGMRHWNPRIREAVRQMAEDGVRRAVALCMAPHYSEMSIGAYYRLLDAALLETGADIDFHRVQQWYDEPLFLDALAGLCRRALERFAPEERGAVQILFTAHSLPERFLKSGDPYPDQLRATAEEVARRLGWPRERWGLAYQSAARSPEPWLRPTVEETIRDWAQAGHRHLLVAPVGFVAEHIEILYDLDIAARQWAEQQGVRMERAPLPNAEPAFIAALQAVVQRALEPPTPVPSGKE